MQLLNTEQAAERLTLKKQTLEAWRIRGGGPNFLKIGRAVRYREEDLNEFLLQALRENTSADTRPGARVGLLDFEK